MADKPRVEIGGNQLIVHPEPFRDRFWECFGINAIAIFFALWMLWIPLFLGLSKLVIWIIPTWDAALTTLQEFLFPGIWLGSFALFYITWSLIIALNPERFSFESSSSALVIKRKKKKTIISGKDLMEWVRVRIVEKKGEEYNVEFKWTIRENEKNLGHTWRALYLEKEDVERVQDYCKKHNIKIN